MTNQIRFLYLPTFAAFLLQLLLLSSPTSSFSLSPGPRFWTPLRSAEGEYNNADEGEGGEEGLGVPLEKGDVNFFEKAVRRVTKKEDYKFGDITKSVVNTTTHGFEDTVRSVTHNKNYHFGDLTKKVVGSSKGGFEGLVQSVTNKEDYEFGDLTKGVIGKAGRAVTYSGKTLSMINDHNIHEAVELLNVFWTKSMNYEEQREAFIVFVYLGAALVLSYNFVANAMSGLVFAAAWTNMSASTGLSPLSPGMWLKFLERKATYDLFFGGPCLPVRAIITIPWFFYYRKFVVGMASRSPMREKMPALNRCMSLLVSWAVANLAFVGGLTFLLVKLLSFKTGVPVFPATL